MAMAKQDVARYVKRFIAVALALSLCFILAYIAFPAYRGLLVEEDRIIEMLGALLEAGAFLYGLFLAIRTARSKGRLMGWAVFVSLVGLWSFLEDMSYGQRIFGFESPIVYGVPIDGLHDFAYVGKVWLDILIKYQLRRLAILVAVMAVIVVGLTIRYWPRMWSFLRSILTTPHYLFFALYVVLQGLGAIVDLDMFAFLSLSLMTLIEEILEFNAVLALFFCCIVIDALTRPASIPAPR